MSRGLTPYEFVQQVYYVQEKTILDFWPTDDKYKEVLFEANLVLQELQNSEDWSWLRERIILGEAHCAPHEIPEFELPDWVYKPSTLHGDCLKLYHHHHGHIHEGRYIEIPYGSVGEMSKHRVQSYDKLSNVHMPDMELRAFVIGNTVTFNRPFTHAERHLIAAMDVQRRIEPLHICDDRCENSVDVDDPKKDGPTPCKRIEKRILTEIPDPNYVVYRTACLHAEGSPIAQGRIAGLQDQAQKILSAMRENDTSFTSADTIDWDVPGCLRVI